MTRCAAFRLECRSEREPPALSTSPTRPMLAARRFTEPCTRITAITLKASVPAARNTSTATMVELPSARNMSIAPIGQPLVKS